MTIVYLSPHLDDAVLSCGGLIWEQVQSGEKVEVLTIFSGFPQQSSISEFSLSLHQRWGLVDNPIKARRKEDTEALTILGAKCIHLGFLDCIYRMDELTGNNLYGSNDDLFGGIHSSETNLIDQLADAISKYIKRDATVFCPIGFGSHVDHLLVRMAAECTGYQLQYYADFPYVFRQNDDAANSHLSTMKCNTQEISVTGLKMWHQAILAYKSQLSTFWDSREDAAMELNAFYHSKGGIHTWESI